MTDQEIDDIAKPFSSFCVASGSREFDHVGFARALLSRAVPEGHVVVPKEPMQEMCAAGYYTHGTPCAPEIIYRAMIAAAAPANKEGA